MPKSIGTTASPSQAGRGTLRSMPVSVSSDANTGAAFVSFPLALTQSRALTPSVSLNYHANQGNGVFGVGIDISGVLNITRSTSRGGVPQYDDATDIFILSNAGELVKISDDGVTVKYRPRLESQFSEIRYHKTSKAWLIREANGINHTLGDDGTSQITSPDGTNIYQWWVSKSDDARGNKINYCYTKTATSLWLNQIQYGNYHDTDGSEKFAFCCQLDYGDSDATQKDADGKSLWLKNTPERPDQFTHYRAGFPITVSQLCQRITLTHALEGKEYLVKYWQLSYQPTTVHSAVSLMQQIQEIGCRSNSAGQYILQALPPASVDFFLLEDPLQGESSAMKPFALNGTPLPGTPGDYQWVDLYRDGLPGILYNDGVAAMYWRSEGDGSFSAPIPVTPFPYEMDLASPTQCRIMHLGKDKQTAFVVADDQQAGYYLLNEEQLAASATHYTLVFSKQQFFQKYPSEFINPSNEVMDLNGNGSSDLVVLDAAYPCYYPESDIVGAGYDAPKLLTLPTDFPRHGLDPNSLVTFTDIFGDGLMHRVSVNRDGITIWPNVGNGCFSEKIHWPLPAIKNTFDPGCVFLVDIDGTGATDFVYAYADHVEVFLNQGQGFAGQSFSFHFPENYTHQDQLIFSDMLGTGLPSIIFIKKDINESRYYTGSFALQKPYLLKAVTQSSGLQMTFSYETSAKAYLDDRKTTMPSIRLPFVLPVLSSMTTLDPVTQVSLTKTYDYHYGEYNFSERRFCGFAYVTETRSENLGEAKQTQDRQVKTWFFNRAASQAKQAFTPFDASGFTANDLDSHYYKANESTDGAVWNPVDGTLLGREIGFALHGQVLRQEIWGEQSDFFKDYVASAPISVVLTHYNIRCDQLPQASAQQQHAILVVQSRESYHLSYEQQNEEPQVVREINLRFDTANNPLETLKISYGRQAPMTATLLDSLVVDDDTIEKLIPLQAVTRAVYHQQRYATVSGASDFYFLHLLSEVKAYNVSDTFQSKNALQLFSDVKVAVATPSVLLQQHRQYYWDDTLANCAALGTAGALGVEHHQQLLLGSETQVQAWYQPLLQSGENVDTVLSSVGYLKETDASSHPLHWWKPEDVKRYGNAANYYQLTEVKSHAAYDATQPEDLFTHTIFSYDRYALSLVNITRHLTADKSFTTQMLIDYQAMKPYQVVDANQNVHINIVDALGRPMASTQYGQLKDEWIGNPLNDTPEESLTAPQLMNVAFDLIQHLKGFSLNDLSVNSDAKIGRWLRIYVYSELNSQPRYTVELVQQQYQTRAMPILTDSPVTSIGLCVSYVDSFGQSLQVKHRTDETGLNKKWLCSGTTIYNSSGQSLQQSLPSYGAASTYDSTPLDASKALRHYYDAGVHLMQQILPSGDRRQMIRTAWYQVYYDQNMMLNKASASASAYLPGSTVVHFEDSAGNTIAQLKIGLSTTPNSYQLSCSQVDVLGRPLAHQDARLSVPNVTITYNLLNQVISRYSVDRGHEATLHHYRGALKRRHLGDWTQSYTHDSWQRLLLTQVFSATQAPVIIESRTYGESLSSPETFNACGQLIAFANETGITQGLAFDLNGECIHRQRTVFLPSMSLNVKQSLATDGKPHAYRQASNLSADWHAEVFNFKSEYDALGHLLAEQLPDGKLCVRQYNALAQLKSVQAGASLSALSSVVSNMSYQKAGLLAQSQLGTQLSKGITTIYQYDDDTQRLISVQSFDAQARPLQHQTYAFDPVGNVVALDSGARQFATSPTSFGAIAAATQQYTYDDFYRLVSAEGLEMPAKPIGSEAKVIPQQYFSGGVSFGLQVYRQDFSYDLSDNLTKIKHTHKDNTFWALDFNVKSDSNQFATLTSTKDNSVVPLAAGESLYDTAGNMQKLDADTDLTWDHTNQLRAVATTVDESTQVDEYYAYRGTAFQDVAFSDSPGDRAAYNPGFFGSSRAAKHPTIDPKPFAEYGNRLYKITCFLKADKSIEVIEQVFLGSYERKRIVSISSDATIAPTTTLIRHTFHLHDDDVMMATHHLFELDINAREASQAVAQGATPLEQWQYHLTDHLKSSVLSLDDQGNVLSFEGYQAYGQLGFLMTRDAKQLSLQDYHYSSEMRDQVTGLYYYGARSYAPQFGRWLSPDPAGLVDGLNLYGFVRNNPMSYWDWWGFVNLPWNFCLGNGDVQYVEKFVHRTKYVADILFSGHARTGGDGLSLTGHLNSYDAHPANPEMPLGMESLLAEHLDLAFINQPMETEQFARYYYSSEQGEDPSKMGGIFEISCAVIWNHHDDLGNEADFIPRIKKKGGYEFLVKGDNVGIDNARFKVANVPGRDRELETFRLKALLHSFGRNPNLCINESATFNRFMVEQNRQEAVYAGISGRKRQLLSDLLFAGQRSIESVNEVLTAYGREKNANLLNRLVSFFTKRSDKALGAAKLNEALTQLHRNMT